MRGGSPSEQFGPYLVYEQLGVGGMASVHRAEVKGIEDFRRPVALKRMLPHVAGNEDLVKAFVREARLASHLRHANVAQTYDLGRVGDIYFIAMELVVGRDLRQILRRSARVGPIPVPVTLNILNQVCDALDYAHNLCDETGQRLGIIHRDVSPSNILVSDAGVVKLIDFGIAKASAAGMQTMSGVLKGKFGYMAPEYIRGSIDARADLFAMGVVAYELLTSRPLFSGRDDLDTLNRVQDMEIAPPSTLNSAVPPEVDEIVMTALARDPERRWQQASALRNAMTTVTGRLGLAMLNGQVVDWVSWLFDQARADDDDSDPSISISTDPETRQIKSPSTVKFGPTPHRVGRPGLNGSDPRVGELRTPQSLPLGTPPRMTAQRSVPPPDDGPPTLRVTGLRDVPPTLRTPGLPEDVLPRVTGGRRPAEIAPRPSGLHAAGIADDATTGLRHILVPAPEIPLAASGAVTLPSTPLSRLRPSAPPPVRAPAGSLPPATTSSTPRELVETAAPPPRPRRFPWIAILVLLAAVAAAAVVYFVLPLVA